MDTNKLLWYIKATNMTASELLHEANPKLETKFNNALKALEKVVIEARKDYPDANIVIDGSHVYLNLGIAQDLDDLMEQIRAGMKDKILKIRPELTVCNYMFNDKYFATGYM